MKQQIKHFVPAFILIAGINLFTACGGETFTDSRDGQKYKIAKIGEQVWMAENLKYKNDEDFSKCPNDDPEMCQKYGRLYDITFSLRRPNDNLFWNFEYGNVPADVCPEGWRLPSEADFKKLISYTDSVTQEKIGAGKALKSKEMWKESEGLDIVGFNAKPASEKNIVTYLAIPSGQNIYTFVNNAGIQINESVNVDDFPIKLTTYSHVDKKHEYARHNFDEYSIRCIKIDSSFESILRSFISNYIDSTINNINKFLNDSAYFEESYGIWSDQTAYLDMSTSIYFRIQEEYKDSYTEKMNNKKIEISNETNISGCPANSKWIFEINKNGKKGMWHSTYQCALQEPQIKECQKIISREKVEFYNSQCINIDSASVIAAEKRALKTKKQTMNDVLKDVVKSINKNESNIQKRKWNGN